LDAWGDDSKNGRIIIVRGTLRRGFVGHDMAKSLMQSLIVLLLYKALCMQNAVKILPYYIYEDYVEWEGQWELIEGIPFAMRTLPVPKHQWLCGTLLAEFRMALKSCNKCKPYQPIDYRITDDTILQPDMLVVCGEITKKYLDFPPALVTEILSPSTALKDRHSKFSIYEKQGIPYYIIIAPETEEVEIYQLINGVYVLATKGRDFTFSFSFGTCGATIDFKEVW
jgi:Uma2 family endonuclease